MKALAFHGLRDVRFESVADPRIEAASDVIVRVDACAICGSDLHVYHERERGLDPGTAMGHEFVGEVVDAGSAVQTISRGARVLSPFTTNCGQCFHCLSGLTSRCESGQLFGWVQRGAGLQGTQAEYVRVPLADSTLLPIPEGVSSEEALLLGDVFSTGYFCAERAGARPDDVWVVLGCGPVGLSAIAGAREFGAETVFAVDSIEQRLQLARTFGARPLNRSVVDPIEVVREATAGRGADAVLEAVGSPSAHRLAWEMVRAGGTLSVVGVHTGSALGFTPAEAYDKNLTYRVGRCPARSVMERLIPVVQSGKYDLSSIVSHRLPLSEGQNAYRMFDEKTDGCTKVVLTP